MAINPLFDEEAIAETLQKRGFSQDNVAATGGERVEPGHLNTVICSPIDNLDILIAAEDAQKSQN